MSVYISKLLPNPQTIKGGATPVSIKYYGIIDSEEDNPIKLELMIEPGSNVFILEGGKRKKKVEKFIDFNSSFLAYSWEVEIEVALVSDVPKAASIRLEATDSNGFKSKSDSFIIYH